MKRKSNICIFNGISKVRWIKFYQEKSTIFSVENCVDRNLNFGQIPLFWTGQEKSKLIPQKSPENSKITKNSNWAPSIQASQNCWRSCGKLQVDIVITFVTRALLCIFWLTKIDLTSYLPFLEENWDLLLSNGWDAQALAQAQWFVPVSGQQLSTWSMLRCGHFDQKGTTSWAFHMVWVAQPCRTKQNKAKSNQWWNSNWPGVQSFNKLLWVFTTCFREREG